MRVIYVAGLSHEKSQQKMRLLTFMQMSENRKEIDFDTIMKEMALSEDEVESFIIDGEFLFFNAHKLHNVMFMVIFTDVV